MTRKAIIEAAMIEATPNETVIPPAINDRPAKSALSLFIRKSAPKNGKANGNISDKIIARPNKNPIKTYTSPLCKRNSCSLEEIR